LGPSAVQVTSEHSVAARSSSPLQRQINKYRLEK